MLEDGGWVRVTLPVDKQLKFTMTETVMIALYHELRYIDAGNSLASTYPIPRFCYGPLWFERVGKPPVKQIYLSIYMYTG